MVVDGELELFIRQEYERLVAAVSVVTASPQLAEEAVQEALARAWERMDRGQHFEHLAGWVATVALNQARSGRRRRASERLAVERLDAGRSGYSDNGLGTEHGVDTGMVVRSAVEGLARRQREAVVLYYLLDVDVATVATAARRVGGNGKDGTGPGPSETGRGPAARTAGGVMSDDILDRQLREALGRPVARPGRVVKADPVASVRKRLARRGRRRRAVAGSAFTALVIMATSGVVVTLKDRTPVERVDAVAPSKPGPPIVRHSDGVEVLPTPPLGVRGDAAVVWTGAEVVVWGGDVEAANMGLPGPDRTYRDGAAFDPTTRKWRELSPSPLPDSDVTPIGVMTPGGVLIVRGQASALWRPADNTWLAVDEAPMSVGDLVAGGSVAISQGANALLDIESGRWRSLPAPPERLERPASVWTGAEVIVIGGPGSAFAGAAAIAYDPSSNVWRRLPPPPGLTAEALSAEWDGQRLIVVNYDMAAATFDPRTNVWSALPPIPARAEEWFSMLRSAGGRTAAFMANALVVLSDGNRWVPLPYGQARPGIVAANRSASGAPLSDTLFIWGVDYIWDFDGPRSTNVLTAVDLARLVERSPLVQVGVARIQLPSRFSVVDAKYSSERTGQTVSVVLGDDDQSRCTVSSRYAMSPPDGEPPGDLETTEALPSGTASRRWTRDAAGRRWQTVTNSTDLFTVNCVQPGPARALATSARFEP